MFEHRNPIVSRRTADVLRLGFSLVLSLLFHAAVFGAGGLMQRHSRHEPSAPEPLQATLVEIPLPPPVELIAPEPPQPPAEIKPEPPKPEPKPEARPEPAKPRPAPRPVRPGFTATDAARLALQQMAQQPLYPEEAIARGLEGEAVVRLFLDESGNAIAARLESSSGHAILDDAAVRAARTVRSLPTGTPSEISLPVRFRLR